MPTQSPAAELLTVREAAHVLKVSPETIRRRVRAGDLPARKLSQRAIRICRDDLDALARPTTCDADPLERHITQLVEAWPRLSQEQIDRVAMLLRPTSNGAAA